MIASPNPPTTQLREDLVVFVGLRDLEELWKVRPLEAMNAGSGYFFWKKKLFKGRRLGTIRPIKKTGFMEKTWKNSLCGWLWQKRTELVERKDPCTCGHLICFLLEASLWEQLPKQTWGNMSSTCLICLFLGLGGTLGGQESRRQTPTGYGCGSKPWYPGEHPKSLSKRL